MKNIINVISLVSFAVLTVMSCNKMPAGEENGRCELTVTLAGSDEYVTKSTGQSEADEKHISNCQVFVFRKDNGKLDASTYNPSMDGAGSCSVSLNCTVGQRIIWVVVNAPEDYSSRIMDETSLKAVTTDLKDNRKTALLMVGNKEQVLNEGACSVDIPVTRAAASIVLQKITVDMEARAYQKPDILKVRKIYLLNVCGRTNLAFDINPSAVSDDCWYSKLSEESDPDSKALISDDLSTPVVIGNGGSDDTVYTFYAYPNSCAHSVTSPFSPRATLLVVEAELAGELYYYPLKFDSLESNKKYVISNLTIRRPGSGNPYEPVLFSAATSAVSVKEWGDGASRTEII